MKELIDKILFLIDISDLLYIIAMLVILFCMVVCFRKRVNEKSKVLIDGFLKNRKYIKGLFVEVNDTKELLRYFVNGAFWRLRIVKDFNILFDDEYGKLFRKMYINHNIKFKLKP